MSHVRFQAQDAPPLSLRLYRALPIPPVGIGLLLSLLYLLGVIGFFGMAGGADGLVLQGVALEGQPFWQIPGWWTLLVNALMVGFAPTVMVATLRSVEQDLRDLAPPWAWRRTRSLPRSGTWCDSTRGACGGSASLPPRSWSS